MALTTNFYTDLTASDFPLTFPITIQFTDSSTGSPDSWFWNFGDGSVSSDQSPSHTYSSKGTFNITLYSWKNATSTTHALSRVSGRNKQKIETPRTSNWSEFYSALAAQEWNDTGAIRHLMIDATGPNQGLLFFDEITYRVDLTSVPNSFLNFLVAQPTAAGWSVQGDTARSGNGPSGSALKVKDPNQWITFDEMVDDKVVAEVGVSGILTDFTITDGEDFSRWDNDPNIPGSIGYRAFDFTKLFQVKSIESVDQGSITKPLSTNSGVDFVGAPLSGSTPLEVAFNDTSIINIVSWKWDFGDGNTSTIAKPTNTYITNS